MTSHNEVNGAVVHMYCIYSSYSILVLSTPLYMALLQCHTFVISTLKIFLYSSVKRPKLLHHTYHFLCDNVTVITALYCYIHHINNRYTSLSSIDFNIVYYLDRKDLQVHHLLILNDNVIMKWKQDNVKKGMQKISGKKIPP